MRVKGSSLILPLLLITAAFVNAEPAEVESGTFAVDTRSALPMPDSDGDGLPDAWEIANDLAVNSDDASADPDADGFSNLQE